MEDPIKKPEADAQKKEIRKKQKQALLIFADAGLEFALLIFLPLWVFIYIGKKYGLMHSSLYVIFGLIIATSVSIIAIWKRVKDFRERLK